MSRLGFGLVIYLLSSVFVSLAFADENQNVWSSVRQNLSGTFESRLYGPSISDFSGYQPNLRTGGPGSIVDTDNKLALNYKVKQDLLLSLQTETYWNMAVDHAVLPKDPSIAVKAYRVLQSGIYSMDTVARFYAGLSDASHGYHQWGALRVSQASSLKPVGSRFRMDLYSYIQKDFLNSEANDKSWSIEYFISPTVEYRFTPNLAANMAYKLWAYRTSGQSLFQANTDKGLMGPGLVWNMRPNLSLNPYIDVAVNEKVSMNTTTLGAYLWWGFL